MCLASLPAFRLKQALRSSGLVHATSDGRFAPRWPDRLYVDDYDPAIKRCLRMFKEVADQPFV